MSHFEARRCHFRNSATRGRIYVVNSNHFWTNTAILRYKEAKNFFQAVLIEIGHLRPKGAKNNCFEGQRGHFDNSATKRFLTHLWVKVSKRAIWGARLPLWKLYSHVGKKWISWTGNWLDSGSFVKSQIGQNWPDSRGKQIQIPWLNVFSGIFWSSYLRGRNSISEEGSGIPRRRSYSPFASRSEH